MMNYSEMPIKDVASMVGVKDLPVMVRGKFAQALKAESAGNTVEAVRLLDEAIEAEVRK